MLKKKTEQRLKKERLAVLLLCPLPLPLPLQTFNYIALLRKQPLSIYGLTNQHPPFIQCQSLEMTHLTALPFALFELCLQPKSRSSIFQSCIPFAVGAREREQEQQRATAMGFCVRV